MVAITSIRLYTKDLLNKTNYRIIKKTSYLDYELTDTYKVYRNIKIEDKRQYETHFE